ncbi:UDP-sugar pyrophosphorylase [Platanthera guangdongensis]|uniref:UTP-monosaccharide-1-phosphate uridylyltransferase n=1 Tax=Platanthera guangdongensis TaxID=2320717 RepID=A0ABR2MFJ5_9ASPA
MYAASKYWNHFQEKTQERSQFGELLVSLGDSECRQTIAPCGCMYFWMVGPDKVSDGDGKRVLSLMPDDKTFHVEIPFVIMTSDDTHIPTLKLLESNYFFGMKPDQVILIKQDDNDARIALDPNDKYMIQTKPHGHGDVHSLLYNSGLLNKWRDAGLRWVVFYQDTNGLLFKIHHINWSSSILTYHENFVYSFDKGYQVMLTLFTLHTGNSSLTGSGCRDFWMVGPDKVRVGDGKRVLPLTQGDSECRWR